MLDQDTIAKLRLKSFDVESLSYILMDCNNLIEECTELNLKECAKAYVKRKAMVEAILRRKVKRLQLN